MSPQRHHALYATWPRPPSRTLVGSSVLRAVFARCARSRLEQLPWSTAKTRSRVASEKASSAQRDGGAEPRGGRSGRPGGARGATFFGGARRHCYAARTGVVAAGLGARAHFLGAGLHRSLALIRAPARLAGAHRVGEEAGHVRHLHRPAFPQLPHHGRGVRGACAPPPPTSGRGCRAPQPARQPARSSGKRAHRAAAGATEGAGRAVPARDSTAGNQRAALGARRAQLLQQRCSQHSKSNNVAW